MSIKVELSNIVTCFEDKGIGTRVVKPDAFWGVLLPAIKAHDTSSDRAPGQHFIVLEGANELVSQGVRERTDNPEDYVNRLHRGRVEQFLRRHPDAPDGVTNYFPAEGMVAAIVYTIDAYLSDPEVEGEVEEAKRISESGCDYVLVAVIAGPALVVSAYRLLSNLCGGNKEWDFVRNVLNEDGVPTGEEIAYMTDAAKLKDACYHMRKKFGSVLEALDKVLEAVKATKEFEDKFCVVAD